jgi:DinB superfamily
MPAISEGRDAILQQLENSEQAGVSHGQANWQPNSGRSWSIWQCLDHLVRTNRTYCQSMQKAIERTGQRVTGTIAITPGWFGRWFIAKMEPPVQTAFRAVKKVTPGAEGDPHAALRDFVDSHTEARHIVSWWERADFNRIRFQNPFVPFLRFTVGTGLMIINAHDRRHLWQAGHVKQFEGYPAA